MQTLWFEGQDASALANPAASHAIWIPAFAGMSGKD